MQFIITGAAFLLALLVAIVSYAFVPYFAWKADETIENKNTKPCISFLSLVNINRGQEGWKLLVFFCIISGLCAWVIYIVYGMADSWAVICKGMVIILMLLAAAIIDQKTHMIPNEIILTLLGSGMLFLLIEFFYNRESFINMFRMACIGLLVCIVLFYILARLTRNGLGFGDVKLITSIGWMIGLAPTLFTVLFALILCSFAAIFLLLKKKKSKKDRLAFAPFLFLGYIVTLLFSI